MCLFVFSLHFNCIFPKKKEGKEFSLLKTRIHKQKRNCCDNKLEDNKYIKNKNRKKSFLLIFLSFR